MKQQHPKVHDPAAQGHNVIVPTQGTGAIKAKAGSQRAMALFYGGPAHCWVALTTEPAEDFPQVLVGQGLDKNY